MRYVNDKYREYYKIVDRNEKYSKDKKDYSNLLILFVFIAPLFMLILLGSAISISNKNKTNNEKDRFIELSRNSLGCIQYKYNSDRVWKCPTNPNINQIERVECSSGKIRTCTTHYDPVIK